MKTAYITTRVCRLLLGAGLGLTAGIRTVEAAYVILPNNTRVEGTDIRARGDGEIILTTPQGQRTFLKGQYLKAVADKPAEFDRAGQLAAQKNYDEAIRILNDLVTRFRFLEWDNNSRIAIARIQVMKGDHAAAVDTYEQLFRAAPEYRSDANVIWPYRQAMLEAKQYDKLSTQLDEAIAKGTRADAARAQVMRGDVKMAQGQVEGAVMDYLRTAILFEAEKTVQPEAVFKAAEGLEKLRDPRAKEMYQRVARDYPGTPYAERAKAKM